MSYRTATSITQDITLTGHNAAGEPYAAIVRALRAPEEDAVQAAMMGGRKQKANASTVDSVSTTTIALEMDSAARIEQTLLLGIVSWNLDGDPGDDMDANGMLRITATNLAVLTALDRNKLFEAINDLTDPPDPKAESGSVIASATS